MRVALTPTRSDLGGDDQAEESPSGHPRSNNWTPCVADGTKSNASLRREKGGSHRSTNRGGADESRGPGRKAADRNV